MKSITLKELKALEENEYNDLENLIEALNMYKELGYNERVESCNRSIIHKRGRWGMLTDLIDQLQNN